MFFSFVKLENLILTRKVSGHNPNHVGTRVGTRRDTSGQNTPLSGHMSGHVGTRRDTIRDWSKFVEIQKTYVYDEINWPQLKFR